MQKLHMLENVETLLATPNALRRRRVNYIVTMRPTKAEIETEDEDMITNMKQNCTHHITQRYKTNNTTICISMRKEET